MRIPRFFFIIDANISVRHSIRRDCFIIIQRPYFSLLRYETAKFANANISFGFTLRLPEQQKIHIVR